MNIIQVSILLVATGNIVLLVMLLSRSASNRKFATDVREDLRLGREELRASSREAHATVTVGIRTFTEIG